MATAGGRSECLKASLLLFLLGTAVTVYQWLNWPSPGFGAGVESVALARNLAEHGVFANPFAGVETGPSAHLAPLFPFFLAGLIKLFEFTPVFVLAASLMAAVAHGLHAALLPWVSRLFYSTIAPGVAAALLSVILPALQFTPAWEPIYTADGLMLFCLCCGRLPLLAGRGSVMAGAFAGLLMLLNPATIFVTGPWFFLQARRQRARAVFVLGILAVCLPWNLRNYRQFHQWFFIRDNLGLELQSSNNDQATSSDVLNHWNGDHAATQLHFNHAEAAKMRGLGEAEYNRQRMAMALDWIRAHPARFVELTLRRTWEFWFPNPAAVAMHSYTIWLITALSIPGMLLRTTARSFIASVCVLYPLVYYLVQSSVRFRYPILWLSLLAAGYGIIQLVNLAGQAGTWRSHAVSG